MEDSEKKRKGKCNKGDIVRTVITPADTPSVDHGLPSQQVILADGAEALDALLVARLGAPGVEFLDEAAGCAAGG